MIAFKDTVFTGDAASSVAVVSGLQATYEINVAVAGTYYVVAWDIDLGVVTPEAGNYVGAYGWTGTESLEADVDSQALNIAIGQNAASVEVNSIATANFTMHEIISGSEITVSASAAYPSTVTPEATCRSMLFMTSDITNASDFMGLSYKMSQSENVSPGEDVNFSFVNVGGNSYYCLVFAMVGDAATHVGAYGWPGTSEVSGDSIFDDSGDLWQNKVSFEVLASAVSLGAISLHQLSVME